MRAYLWTTGAVFGLVTLAHVWRMLAERPGLAAEPFYLLITLAAAGLAFWAWRLLRRLPPGV